MAELECFFLRSFQGRKIIEVLAAEMTVGGTAYFSVNSLSKPLSLPNIAIATEEGPTLLSLQLHHFCFYFLLTFPLFVLKEY